MNFNFKALPVKITYSHEVLKGEWPHDSWRVEFSKGDNYWSTEYKTGLGLRKPKGKNKFSAFYGPHPVMPSIEDVMYSLLMDSDAAEYNFSDWCGNYGYSDDSISALNTYKACLNIASALRRFIPAADIKAMREELQDY